MDPLNLAGIGLGLSMDAFAVSVANGFMIKELRFRHALRMAVSFGLFQAAMPLLGWAAGLSFAAVISSFDHWLAFGLLGFVGGKMLWESFKPGTEGCGDEEPKNCSQWPTLLLMSLATSLDALAVGLSFAFLRVRILEPAAVIGCITFAVSLGGVYIGERIGQLCENLFERAGGVILIAIGLKILIEHLTAV